MKTTAAILVETGKPLVVTEIEIPELKPGQVLVEIAYSGVCYTQVMECRGHKGKDPYVPHCLGHEGSGTVMQVSSGVSKVKPGDKVILSWIKGSGSDISGTVYRWGDKSVNAGGVTTFSKHSVISENRLTKLPEGISMDSAALMGCALPTGLGVVFNTIAPKSGQSLVVLGSGGIGLCAIAGASTIGCSHLIAVDVSVSKLKLATEMGATHTIDASKQDPISAVQKICPGGVDFAIEATGRPEVMDQALRCVRGHGGIAAVVGNAKSDEFIKLDPKQLNFGKQLRGTWGGDNNPDRDYPRYLELLSSGKIKVQALISNKYPLEEINSAIDDLESGRAIRPLIAMI